MNFEYWINALHDEDWTVQVKAARTLGELGDSRAVPNLVEILLNEHEWTAIEAAIALGKIKNLKAVPALLEVLRSEKLRKAYDNEIEKFKSQPPDPRTVSAIGVFIDNIESLRAEAARALGQIGDPRAIPDLIEAMYDTHITSVSTIAASALEEISMPEAIVAVQKWRQNLKS